MLAIAVSVAAQAANVPTSLVGEYHGAVNFHDDQVDTSWYAENEHTGWLPLTVKMAKDGKASGQFTMDDGLQVRFSGNAELSDGGGNWVMRLSTNVKIYDSIIPFEFRFFDDGETQKCVVSATGKEVDEEDEEEDFLTFSGTAYKYEANAEKVRPYVGTYTLYFDTEGLYTREEDWGWQTECSSGRSVFTVKIDAKGNATVSAELCDGSKTSGNAKFVSNGEFTGVETGLYTSKFRSYDLGGNATKTTNWQGGIGLRFAIGFNDSGKVIVEDAQSFAFDYDFKNDTGFVDYASEFSHATMALLNSDAASFSVKLDAASGKVSPAFADIVDGKLFGSLPMPTRKGYVFAGWWTAKVGGTHITDGTMLESSDFAGQKTPTIYAHWLQLRKLTMKDESASVSWSLNEEDFDPNLYYEILHSIVLTNPDRENGGYLEGKGVLEVLPGARVSVSVSEYTEDKNWNELIFQKWTVSTKGNLGPDFRVTHSETELTMPDADVTLKATYIDESTCGVLVARAYASDVQFGWDEEAETQYMIEAPSEAFEWSPDGGKTWYKTGEAALLKAGAYTVTWRSADPNWRAPSSKTKTTVAAGEENNLEGDFTFTYIPQVIVDVMTIENGELQDSAIAGTVTMNPKDGLAPVGKTVALTAKAAKGYAFQGWTLADDWTYDVGFWESSATWKFENSESSSSQWYFSLNPYIDPVDKKVHVKAIFKAFSAYSADDIVFNGIGSYGFGGFSGYYSKASDGGSGNPEVVIKAVAGCALDNLKIDSGLAASPLAYKLNGKLPDGVKFDAKTGVLSGAPKKAGSTSVTITATDPAKNAKRLAVNFVVIPLPEWLVGEFRGVCSEYGDWEWDADAQEDYYVPGQQNGILELSVKSDGKVSAKVSTCLGTTSLSGTLTWHPGDEEEPDGIYSFWAYKGDSSCDVDFNSDGTIKGHASSYQRTDVIDGEIDGMHQDTTLLVEAPFLDKYYTFAFCATKTESSYYWDDELGCSMPEELQMQSGYGYLTIKTDAKGVAKVAGQLPDGEKVSMSALVLPFVTNDVLKARLYVFASPSSYKKQDWFAMSLVIAPDCTVTSEENAAWTPEKSFWDAYYSGSFDGESYDDDYNYMPDLAVTISGAGALYSEAKSLENYYWAVSCEWNENVRQQYSWKEDGETYYDNASAYAQYFDDCGFLFNVAVKGDSKGAISLVEKSAAPWEQTFKEDGQTWKEWNYETDKNGNEITDPSQLSISFTKATGIFTGKANAYFDYWQPNYKMDRYGDYHDAGSYKHVTASLPYSGVMIYNADGGSEGYGSAVHTYKYSYGGYYGGTAKTDTKKVTLPVSLMPVNVEP